MQGSSADGSTQKKKMDGRGERRRVRVLVVDDHTMFREGLASMLASSYGDEVEIVGKTNIGGEAVTLAQEKEPDVITMQVDRTLKKARNTLKQMREGSSSSSSSSSPPKVIILTMFEDPRLMREILELGAQAYIHKSASVEELFAVLRSTVRQRVAGEHVVVAMPQQALELAEDGFGKDGEGSVLSRRELEILLLTARGLSNRRIASHLGITEGTVKRHLANMYPKMGIASRGEAVRLALENEWFTMREIEAAIDDE
jgi:DNA-binding NarL/FixJ family response regulator